jgi:uncharacterized MAPEG superfamily protein
MPLLRIYALTAIVLTFKMIANSVLQGIGRTSSKIYTIAEDAPLFGGRHEAQEAPAVARASACWRNDLENIPIFLILAWIYVAAGDLSVGAFELYCVVFVVARILHTVLYLKASQPWRTIAFTIGLFTMVALAIHLLLEVAFA